MSIHVNTGGLWREASPSVNVGGVWKNADAFARQGGVWYQTTSNGINVVIDSAAVLYDFNLKTWLQGAGLWPASGPVVINELRITARTVITHRVMSVRVPDYTSDRAGTPVDYHGYKKTLLLAANQATNTGLVYRHNIIAYDQDLSVHAFTTGTDWPAGSSIKTFILEGRIIGRGGDGCGMAGSTFTAVFRMPGATNDGTATLDHMVGMRHGWPALHTSIPIQTLSVTGELGGGGAGGMYPGVSYTMSSANNTKAGHDARVAAFQADSCVSNLYHMLQAYASLVTVALVPMGRYVTPTNLDTTTPHNGLMIGGNAKFVMHGGGGGQGGSFGGISRKMSNTSNSSYYYTYTNGVDGGAGTLNAPGGAGTSTVTYATNDSKYGGVSGRVEGGGIPGAALGQDGLHKLDVKYVLASNSSVVSLFDGQPSADYTYTGDYTYTYFTTPVIYTRGGNAITGKSLITSATGNIKGRQVG